MFLVKQCAIYRVQGGYGNGLSLVLAARMWPSDGDCAQHTSLEQVCRAQLCARKFEQEPE